MDIRYSANQRDFKRYTTEETRKEFLIEKLFEADDVVCVYSHVDRMVTMGIMPVNGSLPIDKGIDVWKNFGTKFFLERREIGIFNVGGKGKIVIDGTEYAMNFEDCIYISMGTKEVVFSSDSSASPAKFYAVSAPAHKPCPTTFISMETAAKRPLGEQKTCNKRVINQFIHPAVLETCQLCMGLTKLDEGSVWNTMPCHTHERRMEVYFYYGYDESNVVFHLMGEPSETRHVVMNAEQAVISPSWSIHSGAGTAAYTFIWAMGGENKEFDDMDHLTAADLK